MNTLCIKNHITPLLSHPDLVDRASARTKHDVCHIKIRLSCGRVVRTKHRARTVAIQRAVQECNMHWRFGHKFRCGYRPCPAVPQ